MNIDLSSFILAANDEIPVEHWTEGLPVYQDLVKAYSRRKLTFTTDVVNAFAGFSSIFEECCGGTVVSAMPVSTLSSALVWVAMPGTWKRTHKGTHVFPSWCWTGWKGGVRYPAIMRKSSPVTSFSRLENTVIYTVDAPCRGVEEYADLSKANIPITWIQQFDCTHRNLFPPVELLALTAPTMSINQFQVQPSQPSNKNIPYCSFTLAGKTDPCGILFGIPSIVPTIKPLSLVLISHDLDLSSRARLRAS